MTDTCWVELTDDEALRLPWIGIDPARVITDSGDEGNK